MIRQRKVEQQPKLQRYLQPLRSDVGEGTICLTTLRDFSAHAPPVWIVKGAEPHDAVCHSDVVWGAFCGSIRGIDLQTGATLRTIENTRFTNLHSLAVSPPGDCLLVANTGLDELLEIDLLSGTVEWSWRPSDHGWTVGPFGVPIVSSAQQAMALGLVAIEAPEARARLLGDVLRDGWAILASPARSPHPLGFEKWQRVAEPNWAGYDDHGETILCTTFCGDAILRIDRASKRILSIERGYQWPHGIIRVGANDYVVTDTGRAQVQLAGQDLQPRRVFSFAEFAVDEIGAGAGEWLQFTSPFSGGTLATVDARRSKIFIWSPAEEIYSEYPVPRSMLVKSIQQVTAGLAPL